ncbi:DNA topoisomerase III [Shewanella yunxiaonensis]|uniref:DNA topoisomerase 3 n=1 Tax=Shewanella yunxiaonensis TaxID=2829809 RepID=A0ABX7YPI5_9GAMM|nr:MULTISPECIES: DNA topoisomerase III [Shewanella]MDF0533615.1 DNA topoisomerase III [Shewanella sp. A32]QUN04638.1 DNA topoisomerase III [Shewanella yunxiaonensis]
MILYIAEKPSLGRAIADALPKPQRKHDGYIEAANGDCVSWCIGHLLEQATPEAYDPQYKSWKLEHLPIVPEQWQLLPKKGSRTQLSILKKLIKQADTLVHAGDPDREGQLLVDEVLSYLGTSHEKQQLAKRLLINDLNPQAVNRALQQMRANHEFVPISTSALARSRADWLYGMNLSRAYTLQGRKVGYQGVLSVGRVQTPLLGLVVRRDEEIAAFEPKPFYGVLAHLQCDDGAGFCAHWQPSEACQPWMDGDGRVLAKGLAENVIRRIHGQPATVIAVDEKPKRQAPPLPYSLSALQIDCNKRFGMSAKEVLDTAQSLYERHKLLTYPRSDSRHLPSAQFYDAANVLTAIHHGAAELLHGCDAPDAQLKSKAWDDSKVDAHHAIIPTAKVAKLESLSVRERQVYLQVARQYLAQFYPHYRYLETEVKLDIAGGSFVAKSKQEQQLGWRQLFRREVNADEDSDSEAGLLPPLKAGQHLHCLEGQLLEKMTQPPKHFTDATLLAAMTGISRFVTDPQIRKVLKDTDGLGTEATRAGIIELLFKRGFLQRQGKNILATAAGNGLIHSLPEVATTPDMTAKWESSLEAMSRREMRYQDFMLPLTEQLAGLVAAAQASLPSALSGIKVAHQRAKTNTGRRYPGKKPTAGRRTRGRKSSASVSSNQQRRTQEI